MYEMVLKMTEALPTLWKDTWI